MMVARHFLPSIRDDQSSLERQLRRPLGADLGLYALNRLVAPLDGWRCRRIVRSALDRAADSRVVFIVGTPRSGSTLLSQLMAEYLDVGYVSNLMARFWMAPLLGLDIHRLRSRLAGSRPSLALRSDHGRTVGWAQPHEFGWFWRRHLDLEHSDDLDSEQLAQADGERLRDEFLAMAVRSGGTFLFKNLNATSYQIHWLRSVVPGARFLWLRRDAPAVASSILRARRRHFGKPETWWSIRPRDVEDASSKPWPDQIAHQISDVETRVAEQLAPLDAEVKLEMRYEDLVKAPATCLGHVADLCETEFRSGAKEDLGLLELRRAGAGTDDPRDDDLLRQALDRVSIPHAGR